MTDLIYAWEDNDPTDDCWLWAGPRNNRGYGPHRQAYELAYGPIPKGMVICHTCDNPSCCRPKHLFMGTQSDNLKDMISKGRHWLQKDKTAALRGEKHGMAKLTEDQVREIRARYASGGVSHPMLAREYGMTHAMIGCIIRRKNWSHVV